MNKLVSKSHDVARQAIDLLIQQDLAASLPNIELFIEYLSGMKSELVEEINRFLKTGTRISQDQLDHLYQSHIVRVDLAHGVGQLAADLQLEIEDLYAIVEARGETNHQMNDELTNISDQLHQSVEDYPAVRTLLESVVGITRKIRDENKELECSLAASTNEISNLRRSVEAIQKEALSDPLTGISNRKSFEGAIARFIDEARSSTEPLALIMADVDHFKKFNDTWGHQTGDQVLRLVAEVMKANIKGQDHLARYGGEEFAMLLPGTSLENAHILANHIRAAVESRRLRKRVSNEDLGVVTMSMGVAELNKHDNRVSFVDRADYCLYKAKDQGRNQVVSAVGTSANNASSPNSVSDVA